MPSTEKDSKGFVDLGEVYDHPSMCCATEPAEAKKPHYPSLYICTKKKIDLGDAGECMLKYRRKAGGDRVKGDGSTEYTYELEVIGMKPMDQMEMEEEGSETQAEPKSRSNFRKAIGMESDMPKKKEY